jgi:hypothetical protein
VGIAAGVGLGPDYTPAWVFAFDPTSGGGLEFYRDPANRAGWTILEETPVMLVLGRGEERLAVSITGGGGRPTIQYLRMR